MFPQANVTMPSLKQDNFIYLLAGLPGFLILSPLLQDWFPKIRAIIVEFAFSSIILIIAILVAGLVGTRLAERQSRIL
jgi:hypothetical protein